MSSFPLPNRTITIDGLATDWLGIAPVFTDPKGDTEVPVDDGSDLKALYVARDSLNLYFMAELYAPANRSNWALLRIFDQFHTEKFQVAADISGVKYVWPWSSNPGITAAYRDVVEFAIPLRLIVYPYIYAWLYLCPSTGRFVDNIIVYSPIGVSSPPGLVLQYTVTVETATQLAYVQLNVSNIYVRDGKLNITETHVHLFQFSNDIQNFTARDLASGSQLTARRFNETWVVEVGDRNAIRIDYSVKLGQNYVWMNKFDYGHAGYICSIFAVFSGEMMFLVPSSPSPLWEIVGSIRVRFLVPYSWKIITPWRAEGNWFDPAYPEGYALDSLLSSSIAMGDFALRSRLVGSTNVTAAIYAQWDSTYGSKVEDCFFRMFQYITSVFKTSIGERYLFIYFPLALDGKRIIAGESANSGGVVTGPGIDPYNMSHQMFHRWNSCWPPYGMSNSSKNEWFTEGATVYYDSKTPVKAGTDLPDYRNYGNYNVLKWSWSEYCKIVGTQLDAPVTAWERLGPYTDARGLFIRAYKASLVHFLLDKIIERATVAKSLDDMIAQIYAKYGYFKEPLTTDGILQAFNHVSAFNFSEIFARYVYGMEQLPLKLIGDQSSGELVVDWREISLPWERARLSEAKSLVFNGSRNTVFFVRTGNIYDDSALGYFYSKCKNSQNIIIQTDPAKINQTGRPLVAGNVVTFGGRAANKITRYYEDQSFTRMWFSENATHYLFMKGSATVVYAVKKATYNCNQADYFVMLVFRDGSRLVFLIWGISHAGTYASGIFFADVICPNLTSYTETYYIFKWTDLDGNGIQTSNEITLVVSGN